MNFPLSVICSVFAAGLVAAGPSTPNYSKSPIEAQEWMHPMCCPERDCRIAETGEVSQSADGYTILGIQTAIRFNDARLRASHDNNTHICSVEVPAVEIADDGDWIELKCLYVPLGS